MGLTPPFYAYIALGSNIGDRERFLLQAIRQLDAQGSIKVSAQSNIYETEPVGVTDQDSFLNMVIEVVTTLEPLELLQVMQSVEQSLGRTREVRWGPRTIDLDLLLFEDIRLSEPQLTLPHPRMMERAFVLVPLAEIVQSHHSQQSAEWTALAERFNGKEGITLWKRT
ncbi:2-amino-4-hydroxy-6-hydroxymethyldihydropteridine diphosphokinase [Paenibacillus xerothermodurans]|uniref:2-amino-4-hydroxy-6-hydroxymethyldihydropteridine diphosphokinase n=1 Tax=Paenibacillus xerothermodurans TaxID=1977292 RepID=A0A2W1NI54_PAEXE|nr:2-amino-4-hydroxy-6-hydroxymethyldihydropteridine diphosphokinase [Paenibacillus xerothermodurans]PZE19235.1 2-amino-4-hydroxy-6-hydroxymethyldihydropteridine diphosphokinase [Paenibacillus xerothermodurans]